MMKKIFGYITVLLVLSWVTSANANVLSSTITGAYGNLNITGFNSGSNPVISFGVDFADDPASGQFTVIEPIVVGALYHVNIGWNIPSLQVAPFSASFDIISQTASGTGTDTVNNALSAFIGQSFFGSPIGSIVVNGNSLNLLFASIDQDSNGGPILLLGAQEPTGQTTLQAYLNSLDGNRDGILNADYTGAHLEAYRVPEPAALLLLGGGLLVMFGFSKKRA